MTAARLVILVSGSGSNMQAVVQSCQQGLIPASVVAVISNRPHVAALEKATAAEVAIQVIDHTEFPDRAAFDDALDAALQALTPDYVVLAGFMRILGDAFVQRWAGRLINIHPSLLPLYPGLDTHARALADGCREHGASVHFVTAQLDGGPVILQARVPVLPDDNAEQLAERVLSQEHLILPQALNWLCSGRVALQNGQACFALDGAGEIQLNPL